jgi:hypothetical protein
MVPLGYQLVLQPPTGYRKREYIGGSGRENIGVKGRYFIIHSKNLLLLHGMMN